MARRKLKNHYRNPRAPKFDISAPRKKFYVSEHACITIEDKHGDLHRVDGRVGKRDPDGDWTREDRSVMLTEAMAEYFGNLGYIEVELDFGIEKDVEIAALHERIKELEAEAVTAPFRDPESEGARDGTEGDGDKDGSGGVTDTSGGEPSGGPSSATKPKDEPQPRRRRQSAA